MVSRLIRFHLRRPAIPCRPTQRIRSLPADTAHHDRDLVVPDVGATSQGELGVHSEDAVGAAGLGVDLGDQVARQRMSDRPCGAECLR